jgi:hypothetical protein
MKGPAGFQRLTNAFMNVLLGVGVSIYVLLTMQGMPQFSDAAVFTPVALLQSAVLSFVVGYTVGDLVPVMAWGQGLVRLLQVRSKVGAYLIMGTVLGACMGLFLGCILSFINNIVAHGIPGVLWFISTFIPGICLVAVLMVLITLAPVMKLSSAISGFDPTQASAPEAIPNSQR